MFAWYRNSAVCLAYLEDLPGDVDFAQGLPLCRWLTRGWTLQELIAPANVEFYDQTWTKRTTKLLAAAFLADTTGVSGGVLADSYLLNFLPVAQRMSWVSRRQTTRTEDIAYCMLGIFDIHMPLIYGEGDKAFTRLQEEIAKQTCDLSLFAWKAPPPEFSTGNPYNYRGIFAKSPIEFAECNGMKARTSIIPHKEFTITNRGLRIEATLMKLLWASPDDLVLNLGIYYREVDEWPDQSGAGWLGIYLRKSIYGWVRVWSHLIYEAGKHARFRCPKEMIHICKHIGPTALNYIQGQYRRAIQIPGTPVGIATTKIEPSDLWDHPKRLFLDTGIGLNIYVGLTVSANDEHAGFNAILACSTMKSSAQKSPTCMIWSEQELGFSRVCQFLEEAQELTDYICVDYLLRDMVPKHKYNSMTAHCEFEDRSKGCRIILEARMKEAIVEGSEAFSIELSKYTAKREM
jgi:hypothetical protein